MVALEIEKRNVQRTLKEYQICEASHSPLSEQRKFEYIAAVGGHNSIQKILNICDYSQQNEMV